jgi:von Willebrand factor type A domain-containing protein
MGIKKTGNFNNGRVNMRSETHFLRSAILGFIVLALAFFGISTQTVLATEDQCNSTADIVLTSDRTTSIANSGDLTNVKNSTVTLATNLLGIAGNRLGLVAFGGVTCNSSNVCTNNGQQASIARPITANDTTNNNNLIARINSAYSTTSSVGTHYLAALTQAQTAMGNAPNPANPNKVIVFFTDGQNDDNAGQTTTLANNIKNSGIRIFTVGFNITPGSNADNVLKGIASSPTDAYLASAQNLTAIFNAISSALSCDDHVGCTTDSCNTQTNTCVHTPANQCISCQNSNQCNDGNDCTTDTCVINQGDTSGKCTFTPKADNTACNDGNLCTIGEVCKDATCQNLDTNDDVVCTALDQCHVAGTCNPSTGVCSDPNKQDGSPCSDNDACSSGENCQNGLCVPGTPINCEDNNECTADSCSKNSDQCAHDPVTPGTSCDDGDICTVDGKCGDDDDEGKCISQPKNCNDNNVCTNDTCDSQADCDPEKDEDCGCVHNPNTDPCDDNNPCTEHDTCANGDCHGTPIEGCKRCENPGDCDDGNDCTDDVCNGNGVCENPPSIDGTACNDSNACTQTDTCEAGVCTGSNPLTCPASDICHLPPACLPGGQGQGQGDPCPPRVGEPIPGCCLTVNDCPTDDGNKCNGVPTCIDHVCGISSAVEVPEDTECQTFSCDSETGDIITTNKDNGTLCTDNDGNSCTTAQCEDGSCDQTQLAEEATCSNDHQCNRVNEIVAVPSGLDGGNGSICNLETCGCCPDVNHDNICDECSDNNPCPASQNPCQENVCQEGTCGTVNVKDGTSCDDGNDCTTDDSCQNGQCTGGPLTPECVPPSCGDGTCNGGETCGSCPADCGECPSTCGNGTCDAGEDCGCSDCAERQDCVIEAQRLKCAQNLTAQGINPQKANELAAQGICETLLEGESTIGGCSLSPQGGSSLNLVGTFLFFGASAPLFFFRRAKQRRD